MNSEHLRLCSSAEWGKTVEDILFPWALGERDLGDDVLEVGPGPGLTTDLLRQRVAKLTAVEIDPTLAAPLAARLAGTNVEVVNADATELPFEAGRFSAVTSFTMLHHVPTVELQDKLFAEVARVLRPGGEFVGVDSLDSESFQALHIDDICVPINPDTAADRLRRAGFVDVEITLGRSMRFSARKPAV